MKKRSFIATITAFALSPFIAKAAIPQAPVPDWLDQNKTYGSGRALTLGLVKGGAQFVTLYEHHGQVFVRSLNYFLLRNREHVKNNNLFLCIHENGKKIAYIENVTVRLLDWRLEDEEKRFPWISGRWHASFSAQNSKTMEWQTHSFYVFERDPMLAAMHPTAPPIGHLGADTATGLWINKIKDFYLGRHYAQHGDWMYYDGHEYPFGWGTQTNG